MKILVVEDDPEVAETVSMAFSMRWPESDVCVQDTGSGALNALAKQSYDLVILDVNLPGQNGFDVLSTIRQTSQVPVIMLTVRASGPDKVKGLVQGADDYMTKPFSPFELLARASAVLRRSTTNGKESKPSTLQFGQIRVDPDTADVFVQGRQVRLSPTEFKILCLLVQAAGKVISRNSLIKHVFDIEATPADAYLLKAHIQHLRRKLGDNAVESKLIMTVRGFGYKLCSNQDSVQ